MNYLYKARLLLKKHIFRLLSEMTRHICRVQRFRRIMIGTPKDLPAAATVIAAGFMLCLLAAQQAHAAAAASDDAIRIDKLIASAYWMARDKTKAAPADYRNYIEALLADGRLTIGLGIGTEDLGKIKAPEKQEDRHSLQAFSFYGRMVTVEGRLIVTNSEFRQALAECEILFVSSHSRFGAGPVFLRDGKENPYRMQRKQNYEIVMPESEVSGYHGRVKRAYFDPVKGKQYVVFEPDSTDLDNATPLHGYQMLVLSTCTSRKHFFEDIAQFRGMYPTTAIFTTRPCCMDTGMEVFVRFLSGVFQGMPVDEVVSGMNEEYNAIARRKMRLKLKPWNVIDKLYAVGINTVP